MKKLLLLFGFVILATSCTQDPADCYCELDGEYYVGDTQYRLGEFFEGRNCDQVKTDQRFQVQLLHASCGIACGTGQRITLQEAINGGSARFTETCN